MSLIQYHADVICRRKVLQALEGDDSDPDSDSSEDAECGDASAPAPATKKQKSDITMADLQKAGYTAAPSVLFMKPPKEDVAVDWAW